MPHLLQLLRRVSRLDQFDRLVVVEAVADDVEEIVVLTVAAVVLNHIAPVFQELAVEKSLRNLFEFSHISC